MSPAGPERRGEKMKISLFVTCMIDQLLPEAGVATVRLLRRLGFEVEFRGGQTCCGQPAFNAGYRDEARKVAARYLEVFDDAEVIVAPSGSCVAFIRNYLPQLFSGDPRRSERSRQIALRTYELSQFLVDVARIEDTGARYAGRVTYHDSCHALRELRLDRQPRTLLRSVRDLELVEMPATTTCCGFGGLFSVTYPEVSSSMLDEKLKAIDSTKAPAVVTADAGCLLQIRGGLARRGANLKTLHLAQVLANTE